MLFSLIHQITSAESLSGDSAATEAFARSALLGMQLAVYKQQAEGKASASVVNCVRSLDDASFRKIFSVLLSQKLNAQEVDTTEIFFRSSAGKKYAKHGFLQVYTAAGQKPPEPLPSFSKQELSELEAFSRTSAGDKLIFKKILQTGETNELINANIKALLKSCDYQDSQ